MSKKVWSKKKGNKHNGQMNVFRLFCHFVPCVTISNTNLKKKGINVKLRWN